MFRNHLSQASRLLCPKDSFLSINIHEVLCIDHVKLNSGRMGYEADTHAHFSKCSSNFPSGRCTHNSVCTAFLACDMYTFRVETTYNLIDATSGLATLDSRGKRNVPVK